MSMSQIRIIASRFRFLLHKKYCKVEWNCRHFSIYISVFSLQLCLLPFCAAPQPPQVPQRPLLRLPRLLLRRRRQHHARPSRRQREHIRGGVCGQRGRRRCPRAVEPRRVESRDIDERWRHQEEERAQRHLHQEEDAAQYKWETFETNFCLVRIMFSLGSLT